MGESCCILVAQVGGGPPPDISISWVIVTLLVPSVVALFWLLLRSYQRAIERAEKKEDEALTLGRDQSAKQIATLEQLVQTNKHLIDLYEIDRTRSGSSGASRS